MASDRAYAKGVDDPMTTISLKLTQITLKTAFLNAPAFDEILLTNGTGTLTVTILPGTGSNPVPQIITNPVHVVYYLEIDKGDVKSPLRHGQAAIADGLDSEGKHAIPNVVFETVRTALPVLLRGPYAAVNPVATPLLNAD